MQLFYMHGNATMYIGSSLTLVSNHLCFASMEFMLLWLFDMSISADCNYIFNCTLKPTFRTLCKKGIIFKMTCSLNLVEIKIIKIAFNMSLHKCL